MYFMEYTVKLVQEDSGYFVQCMEIPAAISQGETKQEAIKNIREAISLVLEDIEDEVKELRTEILKVRVSG
jgi:predicted RNase H-like HicB family nuclease